MISRRVRGLFVCCLAACLTVTGCGTQKNELLDYHVEISEADMAFGNNGMEQNYLSDGICVIPKAEQTKEKDMVMSSKASLIVNDTDGKMLYADNIYQKVYPASITKIVTALVALKYGNLDDVVTISYNASHITEYGAKLCGFAQGDQIVLRDLLSSFLVCSGNDAGIAIAEHISGSVPAFAKLMNKEVKRLGAVQSHFVNPHGLHDRKHYTTAYDLYLIFHELAKNQTFLDIVSQPYYIARFKGKDKKKKKLYFTSTDRYLIGRAQAPSGIHVIGGKTGTTFDAGSCLILYSQGQNDTHYISVVLKADGGESLYTQMNHLLQYAAEDAVK